MNLSLSSKPFHPPCQKSALFPNKQMLKLLKLIIQAYKYTNHLQYAGVFFKMPLLFSWSGNYIRLQNLEYITVFTTDFRINFSITIQSKPKFTKWALSFRFLNAPHELDAVCVIVLYFTSLVNI